MVASTSNNFASCLSSIGLCNLGTGELIDLLDHYSTSCEVIHADRSGQFFALFSAIFSMFDMACSMIYNHRKMKKLI